MSYPFATMKVGDVFFVPGKELIKFGPYIGRRARALGRKFQSRTVWMKKKRDGWDQCKEGTEGAVSGVGVWRIK